MIGITLVAGAAVLGWVNGQAGASEGALGQSAAGQANYYHESFVIVSVQFPASDCSVSSGQTWCSQVSVAIYNNGNVGLTIQGITISSASTTSASGYAVPQLSLSLSLTKASTGAYSMSYTCGSTTGTSTPAAQPSQPIAIGSTPPALFAISLPSSCPTTSSILNGALYSIQFVGLYGNIVTSEVTANG